MGHLIVAESVRDQLKLDKILFIPSANPPHKNDPSMASALDRLEMTSLAVASNMHFESCDLEVRRKGLSYTIDTVRELEQLFPSARLSLMIGVDNFLEFDTWKKPNDILLHANLIVMNRPGYPAEHSNAYSKHATFVRVPNIGISGTEIRRRIASGKSIRYLVPEGVESFILRTLLYKVQ